MTEYPFYLVVLLFATLLMGHSKREKEVPPSEIVRKVGDTLAYNLASEIGMFGLALLFGALVLGFLFPGLNSDTSSVGGFSLLLSAGFVGGHGTANVVGTVLRDSGGYEDAMTIGYTFATVGLLAGILGGMVLINLATRLGWTRMVKSANELPESVRRGFLTEDERRSMGEQTVSPIAMDPLTWHVAPALAALALAFLLDFSIKTLLPGKYSLPLFAFSMLAGLLIQKNSRLGRSRRVCRQSDHGAHRILDIRLPDRFRRSLHQTRCRAPVLAAAAGDVPFRRRILRFSALVCGSSDLPRLLVRAECIRLRLEYGSGRYRDHFAPRGRSAS